MPAQPSNRSRRARSEIDRCKPQRATIQSGKIDFHALAKGHYPGTPIPENVLPGLNSIGGTYNLDEQPRGRSVAPGTMVARAGGTRAKSVATPPGRYCCRLVAKKLSDRF